MAKNIADSEYSTQYYNFSPEMFFKDFSETVLEEMALAIQHLLKVLSSPTCKLENKDKLIENGLQTHCIWSQRAEIILHNLKPTIDEFFTIPKNVLLPVDQLHEKQFSEEEIKKLEEEVKELEDKYVEQVNAIKLYKAELAVLEKLEPIQKKVDEAMNAINQFQGTMNEIKELEKLAQSHKEFKKLITDTEEDDSEDSNVLSVHQLKFKTG